MVRNGKLDGFVAVIVIVAVFGTTYGVPRLAGFVGLQWEEDILIKKYKKICNSKLLWIEERKKYSMVTKIDVQENSRYIYIYIYISTIDVRANTQYI